MAHAFRRQAPPPPPPRPGSAATRNKLRELLSLQGQRSESIRALVDHWDEQGGLRAWTYLYLGQTVSFAAAEQAKDSRLYGGIHYPIDNDRGLECGQHIAEMVIARAMADGAR
ncbi:MAG: hypothetical protein ACK47B_01175 [Armatimonadota bacterium]